jgi:glucosyl-dolichyl phosphate glucuronosyltransferase
VTTVRHSFSIVVATRDRQRLLARTLQALTALRWPHDRLEIIIVDNGSVDGTQAVVKRAAGRTGAPPVQYCCVERPGKSYAVNEGLRRSSGDLIALTDDDAQPEPGWLESLASAFDDTGADFVAGRMRPVWEIVPPRWISPAVHGAIAISDNGDRRVAIVHGGNEGIVPIGANMAIRRQVFEKLGGLRVDLGKLEGSLRTGEDHELFLRMLQAGCRGTYEPTAVVHHWVPATRLTRHYFRRWFYQNGRDVARLERAFPSGIPRVLGVPRFLGRQAVIDVWSVAFDTMKGDQAGRFRAGTRLAWFAGHVREVWFGDPQAQ